MTHYRLIANASNADLSSYPSFFYVYVYRMDQGSLTVSLKTCPPTPSLEELHKQYNTLYSFLYTNQGKPVNPASREGSGFAGTVAYLWCLQQTLIEMNLLDEAGVHRQYVRDVNGWYTHFFGGAMAGGSKRRRGMKGGDANKKQKMMAHMITLAMGAAASYGVYTYVMPSVFKFVESHALARGALIEPCTKMADYARSAIGIGKSCSAIEIHNRAVVDSMLEFGPLVSALKTFTIANAYSVTYKLVLDKLVVPVTNYVATASKEAICKFSASKGEAAVDQVAQKKGQEIAAEAVSAIEEQSSASRPGSPRSDRTPRPTRATSKGTEEATPMAQSPRTQTRRAQATRAQTTRAQTPVADEDEAMDEDQEAIADSQQGGRRRRHKTRKGGKRAKKGTRRYRRRR